MLVVFVRHVTLAMPNQRTVQHIAILRVHLAQDRLEELRLVLSVLQVLFNLPLRKVRVLLVQQEQFQMLTEQLYALNVLWVEFPPDPQCQRALSARVQAMLQD